MKNEYIQNVAVIGLGTMGHGIAQAFATGGCTVSCYDHFPAARKSLHKNIERNLKEFVQAGIIKFSAVKKSLARISVFDTEEKTVRADNHTKISSEYLG